MKDDPIRKPRKLRFKVTRALLVSAPLVGSLACGEPTIAINPGPDETPPPVEETVNVAPTEEEEVDTTPETEDQEKAAEDETATADMDGDSSMDGDMDADMAPEAPPPPRMVNPGPRPRPRMIRTNTARPTDDLDLD